jgi:multiple sugar transport system substrate-binding protein
MKFHSKWVKSFTFLMFAAMLVLTACSSKSNNAGNTPAADNGNTGGETQSADAKAQLGIMWWGPDERAEATKKALDLYSKQHANITFKSEYVAWDGFWQKLPTLVASKSVPDILQMDAAFIKEYSSKGVLMDLSDVDLTGIVDPSVIENSKIDGKLYGIPLSKNGQGYIYNMDTMEKAGLEPPKPEWTWDEFFQYMKDAKAKLGKDQYPTTDSNSWDGYQYYQTSYGKGPVFSEDGKSVNLDKDLWMKYNQMYADFRKEGIVPKPDLGASMVENDPQTDPLVKGVLIRGASVGSAGAIEPAIPGKVGVLPMPIGTDGGGWAQSTIFLAVSADTKHADVAKDFVKWFISDKEAGQALGMTRGIPINDEIYKELEPTLKSSDKVGKDLFDVAVKHAGPFYSAPAGWTEFTDGYKTEMEAVQYGQESLEDAYNNIMKLAESVGSKLK